MNNLSILIIALLFFQCSCNKGSKIEAVQTDDAGVLTYQPPIWRTPTTDSDHDFNYTIVRDNIVFEGGAIVPKNTQGKHSLALVSALSGEILWEWSDLFDIDVNSLALDNHHQHDGVLVFPNGRRLYGINLSSGETTFRLATGDAMRRITGLSNRYFLSSEVDLVQNGVTRLRGEVYTGTIDGENYKLAFVPPYEDSLYDTSIGSVSPVEGYISKTGEEMASFYYNDVRRPHTILYRGLYNLTADTMVYSGLVNIAEAGIDANAQHLVYDNLAISGGDYKIITYDVASGDILWTKDFPGGGFTFSGYIVADGILLFNNEDTYLYAMDPYTGKLLWKEKSSGTSSKMATLNGIVYYVGGGDGLLHAVEIATGEHLWRIRSPDLERSSGAFFMPQVSIVPATEAGEKGRIVVSSYIAAMAFEAVR